MPTKSKVKKNHRKNGGNSAYNEPGTGRFKKGNPGKPLGAVHWNTQFEAVIKMYAKENGIKPTEVEERLLLTAFNQALKGDFNFHKFLSERRFGKVPTPVEHTGKDGEPIEYQDVTSEEDKAFLSSEVLRIEKTLAKRHVSKKL